ncbi:cell filamentation protein [Streptomyces sp. B4I13]|uniref:Fic/DOC family protein n=1 Tax=Streptomyces sp. B4I13 TaxID=3042271 RepID=UPI00278B05EC|nr:Fic family protein [Streptomyces sp. B4I13]MDQ0962295.1 cell filamentation protein [Streptomyces sp. B4I13]
MNDPYAMPNGVLRNKLGIADHQLLAAAEADITRARLVMLAERPLPGVYDLGHLQAFHAAIFDDIYPWAGELRTVNIAKRTPFCPARNLVRYAGEIFNRLAASGRLRNLPRREFVVRLAELYGDMNVLHPFREGNGRAQRAFLTQLSADAGYALNWSGTDPQRNEDASVKSFLGDNSLLEQLLDELVATA